MIMVGGIIRNSVGQVQAMLHHLADGIQRIYVGWDPTDI
jgi:hypothetical protein